MKKFFYACAAILCLTLAFHFGATSAQGQGSFGLRWIGGGYTEPFIATDSQIWSYNNGWKTLSQANQPEPTIPVSQIVHYGGSVIITTSGEAFQWIGGSWVSRGSIPGGTTSITQTTFGAVKTKYR